MTRAFAFLIMLLFAAPATAALLEMDIEIDARGLPAERQESAVDDTIRILVARLDEIGARSPIVRRAGPNRIQVRVARLDDDPAAIKAMLLKPAVLTFHVATWMGPAAEARRQPLPRGGMLASDERGDTRYVLAPAAIASGIADAKPAMDSYGKPMIAIELDKPTARAFATLTAENIGRAVAIMLDGRMLSAPVVQATIAGGKLQISGNFTRAEITRLAALLRAGSLPAVAREVGAAPTVASIPSASLDAMRSEKRYALVIGNSEYKAVGRLGNPVNDARDMAAALKRLKFQTTLVENATLEKLLEAIDVFGRAVEQGGVALFYYAGHAIQAGGENYLLPVEANPRTDVELQYRAVNTGLVLSQFGAAKTRINIMILDACRNNPLQAQRRGTSRGLAVVGTAPGGTLVAFATSPTAVADDGDGRNGLFTQEFLKAVELPGVKFEDAFKRVVAGVRDRSGGAQIPWLSSSVDGDFYFIPPG